MNDLIAQARRRYLAENPLRIKELATVDVATGKPGKPFTFPDIGETQVIGCKLGMEYLAICHDEEAVEEWLHTALGVVKDPELAGILFANVFRGVNVVIGSIIRNAGLREQMEKMALEAWQRDFSDGFES